MPPDIQEILGQDYQHRLHRLALLLYLLSQARVLGDTPEVAMMKQQIAELQAQVKKLESQVEVLMSYQLAIEPLINRVRELEWKIHETRDSLDRVADLLEVPRSRV